MARLNVYVPDELASQAREAGLNVSALTQHALVEALAPVATDRWLSELPASAASVDHEAALAALDEARQELDG